MIHISPRISPRCPPRAAPPHCPASASATGGVTTRYWHGLDTLAQSDGTTTQYFAYDGLGSVRQLVDASGSVGLAQTFDTYGNGYAKAGSAASSLGFMGEQVDSNGFVFLRARYFAPGMGRFTQMDPSRQERNVYQYSAGNPIVFTDPSGLLVTCNPLKEDAASYADKLIIGEPSEYQGLDALIQFFMNTELDEFNRSITVHNPREGNGTQTIMLKETGERLSFWNCCSGRS